MNEDREFTRICINHYEVGLYGALIGEAIAMGCADSVAYSQQMLLEITLAPRLLD